MRALVIVNDRARNGARYPELAPTLERGLSAHRVLLDERGLWKRSLDRALHEGVEVVFAAGGDGTVSAVAGALVERDAEATFGAVGLGTSNDFQKPFHAKLAGIPHRTDPRRRARRDVGVATFVNDRGTHRRTFVVSASLGVTARANRIFSDHTREARSAEVAMVRAALRALWEHRNVDATIAETGPAFGGSPLDGRRVALTNLSLSKTPWLSGCLRYDTEVDPASGRLAMHLCEGMGRARLLHTLLSLARGRFAGLPGTSRGAVERLHVHLERTADLELDGELFRADSVSFEVLPRRLWVCS